MNYSVKIVSIVLFSLLLGCNETSTSRYTNFKEAKKETLFSRGWFPDVLPQNTGQIVETHNIDTNLRCAVATIPADSLSKIIADLKEQKFLISYSALPKLPFSSDQCQFSLKNINSNRTVFTKSNEVAVLDFKAHRLYYWSF